jgi:hypothetical protein
MTERDPHLLAALRHAPDDDVLPPQEVSERILAAARAAVRPARAAPLWRRWLESLAQPRVAAAFGTLAVATIVGVMWATHEAPPLAVGPADTPPAGVAEREAARDAVMPSPERTEVAAAPAPPAEPPRHMPPPPVAAAARRATAEPRADLAAVPAAPDGKASARQEVAVAAPPAETAAAAPQALPAPAPAPATAAANLRSSPGALADAVVAGSARTAVPAQPASSIALQAKARAADPGAALDASVQAGPAWVLPTGRRAQADAQRRWWAAVRAATTGRWQAVDRAPVGATALEWDAGGGAVTRFWFDGDALVCRDAEGRVWRAAVGTAAVGEWQAELARW